MCSRIENDENVNPTSANLAIYGNTHRLPTRMMYEDNSDESGFESLSSKRDLSFDQIFNRPDIQVDKYQHPVQTVGSLNEKSHFIPEKIEVGTHESSMDILKERNDDPSGISSDKIQQSEICLTKIAIKKFARNRVDPNENFLNKQTAKTEDFKNMKKWLEVIFTSIEACLESKKLQIENNANLSQKEYNSKKKAQEKTRRGVMKEMREIKKQLKKKMDSPEYFSLRDSATELLMRVNERLKIQDGFFINTMPKIPDTDYALINTSQHF